MIDLTLTFTSFVVGSANRLAFDASRRVAELPASAYNPLVIAGGGGAGKTHLLHAIANEAIALRPGERPFMTSALAGVGAAEGATLLLIDDLHQLRGSAERRVIASACAAAIASGVQTVLTLDAALAADLGPELGRIIRTGLLVELEPPDPDLADDLTRRLAADLGLRLSADALDELASRRLAPAALQSALRALADEARGSLEEVSPSLFATPFDPSSAGSTFDEFGSFLEDVTRVVADAVESVPWRKQLAEVIRRWDAQGIRTDRLETALQADFPEDVEALITRFSNEADRLIRIRTELGADGAGHILDDPGKLAEAETLLASWRAARRAAPVSAEPEPEVFRAVDPWFLNPDRVVLSAFDLEGRIPGDRR